MGFLSLLPTRTPRLNISYDRLATAFNVHMLNGHRLLAIASMPTHSFHAFGISRLQSSDGTFSDLKFRKLI